MYNGTIIHPVGATSLRCQIKGLTRKIHFEIVEDAPSSLLSGRAAEALGLMQFAEECLVHAVTESQTFTKAEVLGEYKDVFTGLGRLPGHYHIDVDHSVTPTQNMHQLQSTNSSASRAETKARQPERPRHPGSSD